MANRHRKMRPAEATLYLKAVKEAGFKNGRLIHHPDGRFELIGEDEEPIASKIAPSPFEEWEAGNADKA